MKARTRQTRPATELNTIAVAPLAMARGAATTLVRRVQRAVEVVQAVRSSVKSVSLVAEPVRIDMQPQALNQAAVVCVPVGLNEVALKGGMQVHSVDNKMTLSMNFDAYLVDRHALRMTGKLWSQASCRFNTQLQVTLHETIESTAATADAQRRRLLSES